MAIIQRVNQSTIVGRMTDGYERGTLLLDPDNLELRVYDGTTAGGQLVNPASNTVNVSGGTVINRFIVHGSAPVSWVTGVFGMQEHGSVGMTNIFSGSNDDSYVSSGTVDFNLLFLGQNYTEVFIGSNSYLTWGGGSSLIPNQNTGPSDLGYPAMYISGDDNSYQNIYVLTEGTTGSRTFRIRFEGTSATGTEPDSPNLVWEALFYENIPGVIDLLVIKDTTPVGESISQITNNSEFLLTKENSAQFTLGGVQAVGTIVFDGPGVTIVDGTATVTSGNPFDQDLNTTDDVAFKTVTTASVTLAAEQQGWFGASAAIPNPDPNNVFEHVLYHPTMGLYLYGSSDHNGSPMTLDVMRVNPTTGAMIWKRGFTFTDNSWSYDPTGAVADTNNNVIIIAARYYDGNDSTNYGALLYIDPETGNVPNTTDYVKINSLRTNDIWLADLELNPTGQLLISGSSSNGYTDYLNMPVEQSGELNLIKVAHSYFTGQGITLSYYSNTYVTGDNVTGEAAVIANKKPYRDVPFTVESGGPTYGTLKLDVFVDKGSGLSYTVSYNTNNTAGGYPNAYNGTTIRVLGSNLGGVDGVNDLTFGIHYSWGALWGPFNGTPVDDGYDYLVTSQDTVDYNTGAVNLLQYKVTDAFVRNTTSNVEVSYGGANSESYDNVVNNSSGDIYTRYTTQGGPPVTYITKLDSSMAYQWTKSYETSDNLFVGGSLISDRSNNCLYLFGYDDNMGSPGVFKLDNDGALIWFSRMVQDGYFWPNDRVTGTTDDNGDVYIFASAQANGGTVASINQNYDMFIAKLSGSTGSMLWSRWIGTEPDDYDDYNTKQYKIAVSDTTVYAVAYNYDDNAVSWTVAFPRDGSTTGSYGSGLYQIIDAQRTFELPDVVNINSATQTPTSSNSLVFTNSSLYASNDESGDTWNLTPIAAAGEGVVSGITELEFSDGSSLTTAQNISAVSSWTSPNDNLWNIRIYNGGAAVTYDGNDESACWFNPWNSPSGGNDLRSCIVEYHAYIQGAGTITGTIWLSRDYSDSGTVTHMEHLSGPSQLANFEFWYTDGNGRLYFRQIGGGSEDAMVQFTSRLFYGSEYYC